MQGAAMQALLCGATAVVAAAAGDAAAREVPPAAAAGRGAAFRCHSGGTIPHSNRSAAAAACDGVAGEECGYACDAGYLAVGRHVCQDYSTMGVRVIDEAFFGGRCDKLCGSSAADWSCAGGLVPVRPSGTISDARQCQWPRVPLTPNQQFCQEPHAAQLSE